MFTFPVSQNEPASQAPGLRLREGIPPAALLWLLGAEDPPDVALLRRVAAVPRLPLPRGAVRDVCGLLGHGVEVGLLATASRVPKKVLPDYKEL